MGIFQKLSRLIRSNINDLIARAENPEKVLNQIIVDMREQLASAKREVAAAIADERKLRKQYEDEARQARDWEKRAVLAVQEDRDDLAKQALLRQQEHADRAGKLRETWEAQAEQTEKLKVSLRQLNEKIEEARRKRNLLIAKQKRAEAQKRIHETMSGLSDRSAFEAFDRMAEKIEDAERRTLASAEVDESLTGDTLKEEFAQLEGGHDVEGRLLSLKREMGLLSGGDEEPKQLHAGEGAEGAEAAGEAETDEAPAASADDEGPVREAELIEEIEGLEERRGS